MDRDSVDFTRFLGSRQQRGELVPFFERWHGIHAGLVWLSFALVAIYLAFRWRERSSYVYQFAAFALLTTVANALICAITSGPTDRLQSRLTSLVVLAAVLASSRVIGQCRPLFITN